MPSSPDRTGADRTGPDPLDPHRAGTGPALPREGGSYVLLMTCHQAGEIRYGRHRVDLKPGIYAYVGSAFGPGGLAARLGHHLRRSPHPRWHIDHLRHRLPVRQIWLSTDPQRLEHRWASALGQASDHRLPRFGASDCRCDSHLLGFARLPSPDLLAGLGASRPRVIDRSGHD